MNNGLLQEIKQQLTALEFKMQNEVLKRELLLKVLHPGQVQSAINLIHYLTLRNKDIRDLQDQLHIHGLSSLASAESHIHRQIQAILQRLGKKYLPDELDPCTYEFSQQQLLHTSLKLFGEKKEELINSLH